MNVNTIEFVILNQPFVCREDEREYLMRSKEEQKRFEKFMVGLGFKATGLYAGDLGTTQVFY